MSQRNPMNERYQNDERSGKTRKSAASAKPKKEAAGTVVMKTSRKTPKERKAEQKEARRKEQERQRELDRKYYKPDTEQYKKLRRIWWISLIGAVVCVIASWLLRTVQPEWLAMVALFGAYGLIIFAFYIDFSKIRKERRKYQEKMVALELEEEKRKRHPGTQKKQPQSKHYKKGAQASKGSGASAEKASEDAGDEEPKDSEQAEQSKKGGLFRKKKAADN